MSIKRRMAARLKRALAPEFARHPTHEEARQETQNAYLQTEALLSLRDRLPGIPLQGMRGYAISPDACLCLVNLIEERRPSLIVELGSGVSTVALAAAQALWVPGGRVVSVDHEEEYAAKTRHLLTEAGLTNAEVRLAPLAPTGEGTSAGVWYGAGVFDDLQEIGLLFIDGPPAQLGVHARWPSVSVLAGHIASGGCVVLDDSSRTDDEALAHEWHQTLNGGYEERDTERGMAIITRN
jgi:predicted O-methyltransferase YrrM